MKNTEDTREEHWNCIKHLNYSQKMRNTQEKFDLTLKAVKYNVSNKPPQKFCLTTPRVLYFQSGHRAIDISNVYAKLFCMSKGYSRKNDLWPLWTVWKSNWKRHTNKCLKKLFSTKLKSQTIETPIMRTTEQKLVEKWHLDKKNIWQQ